MHRKLFVRRISQVQHSNLFVFKVYFHHSRPNTYRVLRQRQPESQQNCHYRYFQERHLLFLSCLAA